MKRLIALSLAALALFPVSAGELTPEQALARCTHSGMRLPSRLNASKPTLVYTTTKAGAPTGYVFADNSRGFMILSADDDVPALLGYSDSSTFDPENLPDGLKYMLEAYSNAIAEVRARKSIAVASAGNSLQPISPMIETEWNQSTPYNNLCPAKSGANAVTGCVATAMAQIIYYNRAHVVSSGSHSVKTSWGATASYDWDTTPFDWNKMLLEYYEGHYDSDEAKAVAELMLACGVSVDMSYGIYESGASGRNAGKAMIEYFGLNKGITYVERDWYSTDEWDQFIYENLRDYGPVLMCGQSGGGGHAFVCDGYNDGYFHINWGWGGLSDGYYLLSMLTPESQGIGSSEGGYNFFQSVVCNIKGNDDNSSYTYQMSAEGAPEVSVESVNLGEEFEIKKISAHNVGYYTLPSTPVYVVIENEDGVVRPLLEFTSPELQPMYGYSNLSFNCTLPESLPEGNYKLYTCFAVPGTQNVAKIYVPNDASRWLGFSVADGVAHFNPAEYSTMHVTAVNSITPIYKGANLRIEATVENPTNEQYNSLIYLVGADADGNICATGQEVAIMLAGHESRDITYITKLTFSNYDPDKELTFYFVQNNYQSYSKISQYTLLSDALVTTKVATSESPVFGEVSTLTINGETNPTNVDPSDINVEFTLPLQSGYLADYVIMYIFPYVPGNVTSVAGIESPMLFADASAATRADVDVPVQIHTSLPTLEAGQEYFIKVYSTSGTSLTPNLHLFKTASIMPTGIDEMLNSNDNAAPILWYDLRGRRINSDNCTPGIYICRQGNEAVKIILGRE